MSKKMKVLIAVLVAILTLTVSGVVAALAQENEEVELDEEEELLEDVNEIAPEFKLFITTESDELLSRVAEILGISEADLSEAFTQAKREILEERSEQAFYDFLERAVEEGLITEEEAEEIMEWWAQKPDALTWDLLRKSFSMVYPQSTPIAHGRMDFEFGELKQNIRERFKEFRNPELRLEILEKAIQKELISEEEAADIKSWVGSKPFTFNQLSPKPRIINSARGWHMIAVHEGWNGKLPYLEKD